MKGWGAPIFVCTAIALMFFGFGRIVEQEEQRKVRVVPIPSPFSRFRTIYENGDWKIIHDDVDGNDFLLYKWSGAVVILPEKDRHYTSIDRLPVVPMPTPTPTPTPTPEILRIRRFAPTPVVDRS